jgi:hypothetical protein
MVEPRPSRRRGLASLASRLVDSLWLLIVVLVLEWVLSTAVVAEGAPAEKA